MLVGGRKEVKEDGRESHHLESKMKDVVIYSFHFYASWLVPSCTVLYLHTRVPPAPGRACSSMSNRGRPTSLRIHCSCPQPSHLAHDLKQPIYFERKQLSQNVLMLDRMMLPLDVAAFQFRRHFQLQHVLDLHKCGRGIKHTPLFLKASRDLHAVWD